MADLAQPDVDVLWFVAQGFMPNPLEHARGVCQADPDHVEVEFIPATEPTSPASSGGLHTGAVVRNAAGGRLEPRA